jgi:YD repeat-containing protein
MTAAAQAQQSYYDAGGRLTAVVDATNGSAQYSYDATGNITSIVRNPASALVVLQFTPSKGPVGTVVFKEASKLFARYWDC